MPITPAQALRQAEKSFPKKVIKAFDFMIQKNLRGSRSVVNFSDIANKIASDLGISRAAVFDNGYLDVEDIYRRAGWTVTVNKAAYNENFPSHFVFSFDKKTVRSASNYGDRDREIDFYEGNRG